MSEKSKNAQSATESTWAEIKADVKKGQEEVEKSFEQIRQWLVGEVAP